MEKQEKCCICGGELGKLGGFDADPLVMQCAESGETPVSCSRCYGLVLRSRLYISDTVNAAVPAEVAREVAGILRGWERLPLARKIELVRAAYPDTSDNNTAPADAEE